MGAINTAKINVYGKFIVEGNIPAITTYIGNAIVIEACGYPSGNPVVENSNGVIISVSATGAPQIAYYKTGENTATITNNSNYTIA